MRDERFKFRVWDNNFGEYIDEGALLNGSTGKIVGTGNYTIEQCTGIRDKYGRLIYEGDIVVQRNEYPYYDYADGVEHKSLNETLCVIEHDAVPNYIGIVEWCEESAQFVIVLECVNPNKNGISNGCCHYFDDDENLEIIGNIHEKEGDEK